MLTDYEAIIIGGGPAGIASGIYTSRAGLRTLLLDGDRRSRDPRGRRCASVFTVP